MVTYKKDSIGWHLACVADDIIREALLKEAEKQNLLDTPTKGELHNAIMHIAWSDTPQGTTWWSDLYNKANEKKISLLSSPRHGNEKTVLQWIESIYDEVIKDKLIRNISKHNKSKLSNNYPIVCNSFGETISAIINDGFIWSSSPEGSSYWNTTALKFMRGEHKQCSPKFSIFLDKSGSMSNTTTHSSELQTYESKTVGWWYQRIHDDKIRWAAFTNANVTLGLNIKVSSLAEAIENGFSWSETSQGHEYWRKIKRRCIDGEITALSIPAHEMLGVSTGSYHSLVHPNESSSFSVDTIGYWFQRIEDATARKAAFTNTKTSKLDIKARSIHSAIDSAMTWGETPERSEYWSKLHTEYANDRIKPLSEPAYLTNYSKSSYVASPSGKGKIITSITTPTILTGKRRKGNIVLGGVKPPLIITKRRTGSKIIGH